MPTALSPNNPRIARVRELRTPRGRRERHRFALEGPTLLAEALSSGLTIEELYATEIALAQWPELVRRLEEGGTTVFAVPERVVERLSDLESPPGLVAVAVQPAAGAAAIMARPGPVLLLAALNDPGNAGTLLRSAEAFGAAGVLFGRGGVDPYAPKVVRAAMGALFRLPVALVTAEEASDAARAAGRPLIAATLDGEPLEGAGLPDNAVIAIGNERHGPSPFLSTWDGAVRIEQTGPADSLNAGVAGSILLYRMAVRRGRA